MWEPNGTSPHSKGAEMPKQNKKPIQQVVVHDFKELQDQHRPALNKVLNDILKDLGL